MNKTSSTTSAVIERSLLRLGEGKYEEVHKECIAQIHQNINDPVPYLLLGQLAFDHKNHRKSLELFNKAIQLAPDNIYCLAYYAQALSLLKKQKDAKEIADRANRISPKTANLADLIGVVYSRSGFHELAIACFQEAVLLNPTPANYHYNLAASLQFTGDFSAAEESYKETLNREPENYRALASLVGLKKQTIENNNLELLHAEFANQQTNEDAALHLGHALAKTYEDLGDYKSSMRWLRKAKVAKIEQSGTIDYKAIFEAAKKTTAAIQSPRVQTADKNAPIFIVGLPRTGTTLVDRIISSHSEVVAAGELNVFANLVKEAVNSPSNLVMDETTLLKSQQVDLEKIGSAYLSSTADLRRGSKRFTDKMPLNFFYVGLIHRALPGAKIIALRRGAMDSCLSNYRQLLTADQAYYNYTYDLSATAKFYAMFDDLMSSWREQLPKECFYEIKYEDVVFDQEHQTRKLLDFCNLEWQERCLDFHLNEAPVSTASSVQVRQPLYSGSIDRWKRYDPEDLKTLVMGLADLAET
ncbi:MAG: sulfotransferase [Gammaproteobacteria bacterium]|nr:sulfotransferase [Gammaproteobacteria bacterium]